MSRDFRKSCKMSMGLGEKVYNPLGTALFFAIVTMVLLAILGGIAGAVKYKTAPIVIIVEDRYWSSYTYVRYTESEVVWDSDGDWSLETSTETRCTASTAGWERPVEYPGAGCDLQAGDFISVAEYWMLKYHIQDDDKQETRYFSPGLWHILEPGAELVIVRNILGVVIEARDARAD